MARRELLDVAAAVAGSFVSRNNDVNGYWGLGLLRSYADRNGVRFLRFDILEGDHEPKSDAPALVTDAYRRILARQLTTRRIARGIVTKAEILLTIRPGHAQHPERVYVRSAILLHRSTDRSPRPRIRAHP
jgi:hypothetical protein